MRLRDGATDRQHRRSTRIRTGRCPTLLDSHVAIAARSPTHRGDLFRR